MNHFRMQNAERGLDRQDAQSHFRSSLMVLKVIKNLKIYISAWCFVDATVVLWNNWPGRICVAPMGWTWKSRRVGIEADVRLRKTECVGASRAAQGIALCRAVVPSRPSGA